MQEPLPQKSKAGPAIHLPFERLQFVDFALGDPLAPRQTERGFDRVEIPLDAPDETFEFRNATFSSLIHPGAKLFMLALTHHGEKGLQQRIHQADLL
jgi:hypothetical protein